MNGHCGVDDGVRELTADNIHFGNMDRLREIVVGGLFRPFSGHRGAQRSAEPRRGLKDMRRRQQSDFDSAISP
jgi:hypothetical protein